MSQSEDEEEEDYYLPLEDQRVFGAGIKRKRIAFIPAKDNNNSSPQSNKSTSTGLGDRYLSIVLGQNNKQEQSQSQSQPQPSATTKPTRETEICEVCKQPIHESRNGTTTTTKHDSSIAHQICLSHSHPPSHLDRSHVGVRYLQEYGWDPDSRTGLGLRQEGIRIPIKAKEKKDTAGLGLNAAADDDDDANVTRRKVSAQKKNKKEERVVMLDAGQVRKLEGEKKKRAEKLRQSFYGEDLSRYLEPGG